MSGNKANENVEKVGGSSMIFMPSESTQKLPKLSTKKDPKVELTGSAAMRPFGPLMFGSVDIAESDDSYYFRVSLPGVSTDKEDFSFGIEVNGQILIKGVITTGEKTVCRHNQVFKMQSKNLGPHGPFTMSFWLPGLVDNGDIVTKFESGVLEGRVKKVLLY